jgi:hypothetical protein
MQDLVSVSLAILKSEGKSIPTVSTLPSFVDLYDSSEDEGKEFRAAKLSVDSPALILHSSGWRTVFV